tara:strand:+ start:1751 stop:2062 length:312 start_codon:yes stop_codon:yes gene_type:complete
MKIILQKSTGQILEAFSGIEPDDETLLKNNSQIDKADLEVKSVTPEEHREITNAYLKTTSDGYKVLRQTEYPSIPDQLDEIYHNGINAWKAIIKQTKDKYPKG